MFLENVCKRNVEVELDFYNQVLEKYASDIQACTKLGGILGNGSNTEIQILSDYGLQMGYSYRLCEDVRDTLNVEGELLNRLRNESIPLPILYSAKHSEKNRTTINKILKGNIEISDIDAIIKICFKTEAFEYVLDLIQKKVKKGSEILSHLHQSEARNILNCINKWQYDDLVFLCNYLGIL